jgi:hypothetical protein
MKTDVFQIWKPPDNKKIINNTRHFQKSDPVLYKSMIFNWYVRTCSESIQLSSVYSSNRYKIRTRVFLGCSNFLVL